MFIEEVYRVAWTEQSTINHKGIEYEVSDFIFRECKMITRIHSVLIGVSTVFAYYLSISMGSTSFLADLLMIVIVLAFLSFIMNVTASFVIGRHLK